MYTAPIRSEPAEELKTIIKKKQEVALIFFHANQSWTVSFKIHTVCVHGHCERVHVISSGGSDVAGQ